MSSMCDHGQLNYCDKCPPVALKRSGVYEMSHTPFGAEESTAQREYTPPSTEHLGETARQFDWLKSETEALAAISRGFGNIVDNARRISDEPARRTPEPQRMTFTRKGKKRKMRKR